MSSGTLNVPPPSGVVTRSRVIEFGAGMLVLAAILVAVWPEALREIGSSAFLPHAFCYRQEPRLIWLHVTSDSLIGFSYVAISLMLAVLVHRARRDIPFSWVFLAFGLFIVSCGLTHFMEVATVWHPLYWLAGDVKLLTAVASVATAVALPPMIPRVLSMVQEAKVSQGRKERLERAHEVLQYELKSSQSTLEEMTQEIARRNRDLQHALNDLRRSESRFQRLWDSNIMGIFETDLNGKISRANGAFLQLLGRGHEEIAAGQVTWPQLSSPEYLATDQKAAAELNSTGGIQPLETELLCKDGSKLPVLLGAALLQESQEEIVAFIIDQSERKRAEAALRQSEKLATIGRLAGSIAHEINNPLDAVNNLVYLLANQSGLPDTAKEYVKLAGEELQRVTQITHQMLGFYRESATPVELNLAELLESALLLYARRIESRRTRVLKQYDEPLTIRGFPGELRQVFSNLILNAIEATGRNGTVRLHAFRSHDWADEKRTGVRVNVSDNGVGISPAARPHIFEPFFTTKGEKGTGLGLWVTQGIVDKHGGSIQVRSLAGKVHGTCFSVFVPDVAGKPSLVMQ